MHSNVLSFGGAYSILQKFKTASGQKISSRIARTSKVTNTYKNKISESTKRTYATAMNHSITVAHDHYNYNEVIDAAAEVIAIDKTLHCQRSALESSKDPDEQSTTISTRNLAEESLVEASVCSTTNRSTLTDFSPISVAEKSTPSTSTPIRATPPVKEKPKAETSDDTIPVNRTLKILRSKKSQA